MPGREIACRCDRQASNCQFDWLIESSRRIWWDRMGFVEMSLGGDDRLMGGCLDG